MGRLPLIALTYGLLIPLAAMADDTAPTPPQPERYSAEESAARAYFNALRRGPSRNHYFLYLGQADEELLHHLGNLKSLTSLTVYHGGISGGPDLPSAPFSFLPKLTNLRELSIGDVPLSDDELQLVAGLSHLESLELHETPITDDGLRHLSNLTRLKSVTLLHLQADGRGLKSLHQLDRLEQLTLFGNSFTDAALEPLPQFENLRELYLGDTSVTDAGFAAVARCPNLKSLKMWRNERLNGTGLQHLAGNVSLQRLSAHGSTFDDESLAVLADFPELQHLSLYGTAMTDAGLASIAKLEHLKYLVTSHLTTDAGLKHLQDVITLEHMILRGTIDGSGFNSFAKLDRLRALELNSLPLKDEHLVHLTELDGLERLNLSSTPIGDTGVAHLVKLPNLRDLNLEATHVGDRGLEQLGKMPSLKFLNTIESRVSAAAEDRLRKARPDLSIAIDAPP